MSLFLTHPVFSISLKLTSGAVMAQILMNPFLFSCYAPLNSEPFSDSPSVLYIIEADQRCCHGTNIDEPFLVSCYAPLNSEPFPDSPSILCIIEADQWCCHGTNINEPFLVSCYAPLNSEPFSDSPSILCIIEADQWCWHGTNINEPFLILWHTQFSCWCIKRSENCVFSFRVVSIQLWNQFWFLVNSKVIKYILWRFEIVLRWWFYCLLNTDSMKQPDLYHFETIKITSQA